MGKMNTCKLLFFKRKTALKCITTNQAVARSNRAGRAIFPYNTVAYNGVILDCII